MRALLESIVPLCLVLVGARADAAEITVRTLAGEELKATALKLDGTQLTIDAGGGPRSLATDSILWIAATSTRALDPIDDDATLRLVDGSTLIGRLGEGAEDLIHLETADLGALDVPVDAVRSAAFGAAGARADLAGFEGEADADRVYRRGSQDGDFLRGTLVRVGRNGIEVDGDLGKVTLQLNQVTAIVVGSAAAEAPKKDGTGVAGEVELKSGSVLAGRIRALSAGALQIAPSFGAPREVSLDFARRVRFQSARFSYLSELTPAKVEETPYIGGSDDFLFTWQKDRSVSGGPLVVGGQRFGRGLGLHSRTRLEYDLAAGGASYERLEAFVGVSDEVLALDCKGSVVVRIVVDGKPVYESPILRAGEPARAVPSVPLAGAKKLAIEVDFADGGDVCDRAVVGDPVLVIQSH